MISVMQQSETTERKPWVLITAYDVSTGRSSEGHVAFNLLQYLSKKYRIILVTRKNNKSALAADQSFHHKCPGIRVLGYDLPKWASWWKRGARFYQLYAYLWQMTWVFALNKHERLKHNVKLVHVLNFHNDSIPSLAWTLGLPVVWGPINHNEIVASWRRQFWPKGKSISNIVAFSIRWLMWKIDPFIRLNKLKSNIILSAGKWVNHRLNLEQTGKVITRSQLGVDQADFSLNDTTASKHKNTHKELICAGRLDWIKGVDLIIEALSHLPSEFRLRLVGAGPAEKQLRALVSKLELDSRICFQQPVSRMKLAALYADADLFIFSSAEVAGLVWVEALTCGLPVVAFDGETEVAAASHYLPGIQIVTCDGERFEQIKALAKTIQQTVEHTYDAAKLREAVLAHYSWAALASVIDDAYHQAVESAR